MTTSIGTATKAGASKMRSCAALLSYLAFKCREEHE